MKPKPLLQPPPHQSRLGPRPLTFHLLQQTTTLVTALGALPNWRSGWLGWKPHLRPLVEGLSRDVEDVGPENFRRAVEHEAGRRVDLFLKGIAAYRQHPYRRDLPPVPVVWQEGATRLLDYGEPGAGGEPVLVVPSLVNRAYILDLMAERSLMRYLAARQLRPFLVDWGAPGPAERDFSLEAYVAGRLGRALDVVLALAGRRALLGYCMAGVLALGLGVLRQRDIRRLALLATPWDFHAPSPVQAQLVEALRPQLEQAIALHGEAPVDFLQIMFALIGPAGIERKFRSFADMKPLSVKARDFVAVEDWVNDGVPLVEKVAREAIFGWYVDNLPANGGWRLGDTIIRPQRFTAPALAVVPMKDRIVPPASALALAEALPKCRRRLVQSGHIGMVAGARAKTDVYACLTKWLKLKNEL